MAQNIDFDKYLAAAGFGESVSLGGKRNRKVKPKAPNPSCIRRILCFHKK